MTIPEFWNQEPPYFMRLQQGEPPEDWPSKGTRAYPLADQIRDYIRGWPNGAAAVARKMERLKSASSSGKGKSLPQDMEMPY